MKTSSAILLALFLGGSCATFRNETAAVPGFTVVNTASDQTITLPTNKAAHAAIVGNTIRSVSFDDSEFRDINGDGVVDEIGTISTGKAYVLHVLPVGTTFLPFKRARAEKEWPPEGYESFIAGRRDQRE